MTFAAFFDTCSLYGEMVNDVIMSLAEARFFQPYWSDGVENELRRVLAPVIGEEKIERRLAAMNYAFPDACVSGYDSLIPRMTCDEGDRHVLAAAVVSPAEVLVTFNLDDFPVDSLVPWNMQAIHPDEFLLDALDLNVGLAGNVVYRMMQGYKHFPQAPSELCSYLSVSGLPQFAESVFPLLETLTSRE